MVYLKGYGVETDPVQALGWFRKAAEQGHAAAKKLITTLNCLEFVSPNDHKIA